MSDPVLQVDASLMHSYMVLLLLSLGVTPV